MVNDMNHTNDTNILLYSTAPSKEMAHKLAEALVKNHLVAGVNILPQASSIYHWQGEIKRHEEYILIMHSTKAQWSAIQNMLKMMHPYENPCLIVLPVEAGLPDFMAWVRNTTSV